MYLPQLDRADYPNVKFWNKDSWKVRLKESKGVTKTEDSEKTPSIQSGFLEDGNGHRVSKNQQDAILTAARKIWNHFERVSIAPANWTSADSTLLVHFCSEMEKQFFELQLCSHHWKAERIWINNYPSWHALTVKARDTVPVSNKDTSVTKRRRAKGKGEGRARPAHHDDHIDISSGAEEAVSSGDEESEKKSKKRNQEHTASKKRKVAPDSLPSLSDTQDEPPAPPRKKTKVTVLVGDKAGSSGLRAQPRPKSKVCVINPHISFLIQLALPSTALQVNPL
jgi:hypothetical protein